MGSAASREARYKMQLIEACRAGDAGAVYKLTHKQHVNPNLRSPDLGYPMIGEVLLNWKGEVSRGCLEFLYHAHANAEGPIMNGQTIVEWLKLQPDEKIPAKDKVRILAELDLAPVEPPINAATTTATAS